MLLPLYAGQHDRGHWRNFLTRLLRRTDAYHAALMLAPGGPSSSPPHILFAGKDLRETAATLAMDNPYDRHTLPYEALRPGRTYHMAELVAVDPQLHATEERFNRALGIVDERIIRVRETGGASAWLMLASNHSSFSATDGALLTALAPHITVALHNVVQAEREQLRSAVAAGGLVRAGVGWMAIARDMRVIDIDPAFAHILRTTPGFGHLVGERLQPESQKARHIVAQALSQDAEPRTAVLVQEPRLEALLVPMNPPVGTAIASPALLLFCRMPHPAERDRRPLLANLFGLSPREAELCLLISEGQTIGEAAAAMHLTEETARGYSKHIYAKMNVRGQAELVRAVFQSSAILG
ncbi:helix-turn-helix transcriptional regulator [Sphingobium sp. HBC34]|uniref:Helix-turn-helix transcriptional regulator n=1 Tax=Sphingobium cyanobacteriorum TaxID=3063954 RepID=A0ABT8ZLQ2_9SPHN|nr:helix-turn-helix transcriptional regulator [Sphingobium sp. HBC34]MDO7835396.1 helix-turn-helix transcriptional regulator [Sphingobium sp. HBC34]